MYTEAFLFIGNLLQSEVITELVITKKGFRVRFRDEKMLFKYKFNEDSIMSFIELYETYEK